MHIRLAGLVSSGGLGSAMSTLSVCGTRTLYDLCIVLSFTCSSLDAWQKMVGEDENKDLQVTHSRDSGLDVSSPKHGKVHIAVK